MCWIAFFNDGLFASTEVGVNPIGGRLIRLEELSAALTTPISQGTHWYSVTIGSEEESVGRIVTESSDFLLGRLMNERVDLESVKPVSRRIYPELRAVFG